MLQTSTGWYAQVPRICRAQSKAVVTSMQHSTKGRQRRNLHRLNWLAAGQTEVGTIAAPATSKPGMLERCAVCRA